MRTPTQRWSLAYWILFATFVLTAALNMMKVSAGFATNYLADLVVPAWLYIGIRGLAGKANTTPVQRSIGISRERTAAALILGSAATELCQLYWPRGLFSGRFDPLDLAAYFFGVTLCYLVDKYSARDLIKPAEGPR